MTAAEPDNTAARTALWRGLHVEVDAAPPVLEDGIGVQLVAPDDGWRQRPDMDPDLTRGFRAAIVARARLVELGIGVPEWLRLVPTDFESDARWWDAMCAVGFDAERPAVVASTGVTMYLTKDATAATLRRLAGLAGGSTVVMSFLLPVELVDEADRAGLETSARGASASGTPFVSFFTPDEMVAMAHQAGFAGARHVSGRELAARYFGGRADGLRPSSGEDFLIAAT